MQKQKWNEEEYRLADAERRLEGKAKETEFRNELENLKVGEKSSFVPKEDLDVVFNKVFGTHFDNNVINGKQYEPENVWTSYRVKRVK